MTETQPRSEESSTTDIGTEQSDTVWAFPECLATIPRDVTCCPNCRFAPPLRLGQRLRAGLYQVAMLLWTVTIVGTPIAWYYWHKYHRYKAQLGPATKIPLDDTNCKSDPAYEPKQKIQTTSLQKI